MKQKRTLVKAKDVLEGVRSEKVAILVLLRKKRNWIGMEPKQKKRLAN